MRLVAFLLGVVSACGRSHAEPPAPTPGREAVVCDGTNHRVASGVGVRTLMIGATEDGWGLAWAENELGDGHSVAVEPSAALRYVEVADDGVRLSDVQTLHEVVGETYAWMELRSEPVWAGNTHAFAGAAAVDEAGEIVQQPFVSTTRLGGIPVEDGYAVGLGSLGGEVAAYLAEPERVATVSTAGLSDLFSMPTVFDSRAEHAVFTGEMLVLSRAGARAALAALSLTTEGAEVVLSREIEARVFYHGAPRWHPTRGEIALLASVEEPGFDERRIEVRRFGLGGESIGRPIVVSTPVDGEVVRSWIGGLRPADDAYEVLYMTLGPDRRRGQLHLVSVHPDQDPPLSARVDIVDGATASAHGHTATFVRDAATRRVGVAWTRATSTTTAEVYFACIQR